VEPQGSLLYSQERAIGTNWGLHLGITDFRRLKM